MIKIAVIGVGAAILAAWMKTIKSEYAMWILIAASLFAGTSIMLKLEMIVEELQFLQQYFSGYETYVKLLLKVIGITYLAEFSADLCKDAGANAMASQIEMFGKLSVLVMSMPVITSLLETIDYFLGG